MTRKKTISLTAVAIGCATLLILSIICFPRIGLPILVVGFASGLFLRYCNRRVFTTNYWNNRYLAVNDFLAQPFFRADERRNFDFMNFGSAPSHHAFNYDKFKGLNLSSGCQSLAMDFEILRNYHSLLRRGGFAILGISPYRIAFKEDMAYYSRFLRKVEGSPENYRGYYARYSYLLPEKSRMVPFRFMRYPILYKPLEVICSVFADMSHGLPVEAMCKRSWPCNHMSVRETLDQSEEKAVSDFISFCREREYHPVIAVIPVSTSLVNEKTTKFSDWLVKTYEERCPVVVFQNDKLWNAECFVRPLIMTEAAARDFTAMCVSKISDKGG